MHSQNFTGSSGASLDASDATGDPRTAFVASEALIGAQEQVRSRSHQSLVRRLGSGPAGGALEPNTNVHPRDHFLHRDDVSRLEVGVKPA
jgi:hypothetical protein